MRQGWKVLSSCFPHFNNRIHNSSFSNLFFAFSFSSSLFSLSFFLPSASSGFFLSSLTNRKRNRVQVKQVLYQAFFFYTPFSQYHSIFIENLFCKNVNKQFISNSKLINCSNSVYESTECWPNNKIEQYEIG